jgi:hypothetical protein
LVLNKERGEIVKTFGDLQKTIKKSKAIQGFNKFGMLDFVKAFSQSTSAKYKSVFFLLTNPEDI